MKKFIDATGVAHSVVYLDGATIIEPLLEGVAIGVEVSIDGKVYTFFQPEDRAYTHQLDESRWLSAASHYCMQLLENQCFRGLYASKKLAGAPPVVGWAPG